MPNESQDCQRLQRHQPNNRSFVVKVLIRNRQQALRISAKAVKAVASHVISCEDPHWDEVGIHLVSSLTMCRMHRLYFNDPSLTDCISFPLSDAPDEPYRILGDVFVCPQVAIDYAKAHHIDAYSETTLYIVHGILHLVGYDDLAACDRLEMRKAERRHMVSLHRNGLVLKRQ